MAGGARATKVRLERMIEEAIVDAHDEDEQQMGFLTMFDEFIDCPVVGLVIGEVVSVEGFGRPESDCRSLPAWRPRV